ncbi:MAG: hypothetical protein JWQ37_2945 [Blastococcus sp.]|nr:hypothetical protein [Blastococcus sp.]
MWPWLVQMGFGRAGWYSYDRLERAAGIGDFAEGDSARSVLPQFQSLAVGDSVPLGPGTGPTAAVVDPPRALVLRMTMNALTGAPARDGDRVLLDWTGRSSSSPSGRGRAACSPACVRTIAPGRSGYSSR